MLATEEQAVFKGIMRSILPLTLAVSGSWAMGDAAPQHTNQQSEQFTDKNAEEPSAMHVSGAWVRGLPPGQPMTAAFMQWHNTSDSEQTLTRLRSPQAGRVELHQHMHENGQMLMRHVETLTLTSGQSLALTPGGYHLMLFDLAQPLVEGDNVTLDICFDRACVQVEAPVISVMNEQKHMAHH